MGYSWKRATYYRVYSCLLAINGWPAQSGNQSGRLCKTHNSATDPKDTGQLQKPSKTGQLIPGAKKPKKHQSPNTVFLEAFYQLGKRSVLLHVRQLSKPLLPNRELKQSVQQTVLLQHCVKVYYKSPVSIFALQKTGGAGRGFRNHLRLNWKSQSKCPDSQKRGPESNGRDSGNSQNGKTAQGV